MRTSVPASFSIVMAAVVLAGVGAGFAVAPEASVRTERPTTTTTTTRPVRALPCRSEAGFAPLLTPPLFVAGRDEAVVRSIRRVFPGSVGIIATQAPGLRGYLPETTGVVVLPFADHVDVFAITQSRSIRFVFYDAGAEAANQTLLPRPALLFAVGADDLVDRGDSIVELLKNPDSCP